MKSHSEIAREIFNLVYGAVDYDGGVISGRNSIIKTITEIISTAVQEAESKPCKKCGHKPTDRIQ